MEPNILERAFRRRDPVFNPYGRYYKTMFFIVGMNYYPMYGTYHYPDGNGTFVVYGKDNKARI